MKPFLITIIATHALTQTTRAKINPSTFHRNDIIHRDVAIIGGGATGAHAAIRLRENFGRSVVLIEREDKLVSYNYFEPPNWTLATAAIRRFLDLVLEKGYDKLTEPGYSLLPAGNKIPEDLLLPIGEFAKKWGIESMLARMYPSTAGGVGSRYGGDIEKVITLTVMQSFPAPWARCFLGDAGRYVVDGGNQVLYDRIGEVLGRKEGDVLYGSVVVQGGRGEDGVRLVVESGKKKKRLVLAKKLLIAVQPTREFLRVLDLDEFEKKHFSKPQYGRFHTGIVRHSKLPNGTMLRNTPLSAVNKPLLPFLKTPWVLSFTHYGGDSSLYSLGATGSDFVGFDVKAALSEAQKAVQKMADAGTLPDLGGEPLEFVAWSDHGGGGFGVSAQDMRDGWMADMYALQGKRSTFYTGGGIAADFTTMLWKFNDELLPRIVDSLD